MSHLCTTFRLVRNLHWLANIILMLNSVQTADILFYVKLSTWKACQYPHHKTKNGCQDLHQFLPANCDVINTAFASFSLCNFIGIARLLVWNLSCTQYSIGISKKFVYPLLPWLKTHFALFRRCLSTINTAMITAIIMTKAATTTPALNATELFGGCIWPSFSSGFPSERTIYCNVFLLSKIGNCE